MTDNQIINKINNIKESIPSLVIMAMLGDSEVSIPKVNLPKFTFGKFKGDCVYEHINEKDASYLLWADDNVKFFHLNASDRAECEKLVEQAERKRKEQREIQYQESLRKAEWQSSYNSDLQNDLYDLEEEFFI